MSNTMYENENPKAEEDEIDFLFIFPTERK